MLNPVLSWVTSLGYHGNPSVRTLITLDNPGDAKDGNKLLYINKVLLPQTWLLLTAGHTQLNILWTDTFAPDLEGGRSPTQSMIMCSYGINIGCNGAGLITWFGLPAI